MPDTASNGAPYSASQQQQQQPPPLTRRRSNVPPQLPLSPSADLPKTTMPVSSSPPPSYEDVLAENRLVAAREAAAAASASAEACGCSEQARSSSTEKPVPTVGRTGPLQIQHKSSKALYRAVAAQWGLTCKMSDKCRCLDCQGRYFDCEFEQSEQEKTDGGLGASTPMFISDVMGGSIGCTLL
ncbi:uncharacterized protein LOC135936614 [Cloeon dipterum]|uniref:uncharacterized protein LOC135936614 n=1 Tax=Cloeon dipterum TaxID=197152 RepID=UPI00321FD3D9